jgi:hypothetical protein
MPEVVQSQEVFCREDFAEFCNRRHLGVAVEVGVEQGVFASRFMSKWEGELLALVDDWAAHMPDNPDDDRSADVVTTCLAMMPYHGRVRFFRLPSRTAAEHMPRWIKPQFVYIDASHDRESVQDDLQAWWERLTPDGVMAGHDYHPDHEGVIRAVNEFADRESRKVYLTGETTPSWYVFKGEEPEEAPTMPTG